MLHLREELRKPSRDAALLQQAALSLQASGERASINTTACNGTGSNGQRGEAELQWFPNRRRETGGLKSVKHRCFEAVGTREAGPGMGRLLWTQSRRVRRPFPLTHNTKQLEQIVGSGTEARGREAPIPLLSLFLWLIISDIICVLRIGFFIPQCHFHPTRAQWFFFPLGKNSPVCRDPNIPTNLQKACRTQRREEAQLYASTEAMEQQERMQCDVRVQLPRLTAPFLCSDSQHTVSAHCRSAPLAPSRRRQHGCCSAQLTPPPSTASQEGRSLFSLLKKTRESAEG